MQNGSVIREEQRRGPDVWEFRWREPGADGKRKHRRIVLGSVEQLADEAAARQATSALRLEFNRGDAWLKTRSTTIFDLVSHYRERELDPDTVWKTHSTKVTYEGYLNKWILPRWGQYPLVRINAGEVELWLRSLPLAHLKRLIPAKTLALERSDFALKTQFVPFLCLYIRSRKIVSSLKSWRA